MPGAVQGADDIAATVLSLGGWGGMGKQREIVHKVTREHDKRSGENKAG